MKQIVSNYSYSPATNVVTLTGVNIDQDQLLLIVAPQVGRTMYNFASVTGTVISGSNTRVTLNASTAGLTTTSPLVIFYDDQASTQPISGTVTANVLAENTEPIVARQISVGTDGEDFNSGTGRVAVDLIDRDGNSIVRSGLLPISGTVTANPSITSEWIKVTVSGTDAGECSNRFFYRSGKQKWDFVEYWFEVNEAEGRWEYRSNGDGVIAYSGEDIFSAFPPTTGWDDGTFSINLEQPFIQPISGTVTANLVDVTGENGASILAKAVGIGYNNTENAEFRSVSENYPLPIKAPDGIAVSGTVTVGSSVTIGSLPVQLSTTTIGGTARLNVTLSSATTLGATVPSYGNLYGGSDGTNFRAINVDSSGRTVVTGSVSVGGFSSVSVGSGAILAAGLRSGAITPIPLDTGSGRVAGSAVVQYSTGASYQEVTSSFPLPVQVVSQGSVTIGNTVTIAGTVTANSSNGTLTTRFGTPTTASTAFLSTCVTNANRKYLLIQNVTTQSNVITVGVGFVPTTTQGIQLTAGAGITFESSYIPTGAVWVLSSVTASNYTILEA